MISSTTTSTIIATMRRTRILNPATIRCNHELLHRINSRNNSLGFRCLSTNTNAEKKVHVHVEKTASQPAVTVTATTNKSKPHPLQAKNALFQQTYKKLDAASSGSSTSTSDNNESSPFSISESDHLDNVSTVQAKDYEQSYLPGILLSKNNASAAVSSSLSSSPNEIDMQKFYFALRAFHIEVASIRINEKESPGTSGGGGNLASLRMRWWRTSLDYLYDDDDDDDDDDMKKEEKKQEKHEHSSSCSSSSCQSKKKKKKRVSGNVGSNPTIRSLKHVVQTQNLSRALFETMIDARLDDILVNGETQNDNFNTMNDMIKFYSQTSSTLLLLHLECCGVKLFNYAEQNDADDNNEDDANNNMEKVKEIVNCIGVGIGILNSIRSINTGQIGIPNELIEKHKVHTNDINDPRSIIDGDQNENGKIAIQNSVKEMASVAKEHLHHARLHQNVIPAGDAKISVLSVVFALRYLDRLEQCDYNVFDEQLRDVENIESLNGRLWKLGGMLHLWRAWLTGVF